MIDNYLSAAWTSIAPALANHLWQSTLVAAAAGLLTLALRKHHARARYWLWLAASLKFLVPFSLLVGLGQKFAWTHPAPAAQPVLYSTVEEIALPFAPLPTAARTAAPAIAASSWTFLLPALLLVWACGFVAVLCTWFIRWRRISAAMKSCEPLSEGREVGALRRLERSGGIRKPIAFLLSPTHLEPGIFGIARPVLLWPEGISKRLEDAHLEAILAHEVWHVRRRDNLYGALHMLVEAVFWFYPLVWWLGGRLLEERERACDEEVVELGSDRQVYAESILKVCEFCLSSPLVCVSGVTGADLKTRMVHIMSDRILHKLNFTRKLLLTAAAFLAIAVPITFGLLHATPSRAQDLTANATTPTYSSVSIRPSAIPDGDKRTQMMFSLKDGSFVARGVTLQRLIQTNYHVQDSQISGGPDWLNTAKFDVDAKLDPSQAQAVQQQLAEQKGADQALLQRLLASHFKLATHYEPRTVEAYDLVPDESGARLQPAPGEQPRMMKLGHGELTS